MSTRGQGEYSNSYWGYFLETAWNEIFASVAPLMIHEAPEAKLKAAIDAFVLEKLRPEVIKDKTFKGHRLIDITLDEQEFQTVKIQLRALGLMAKSEKNRSVKDSGTYWTLTPYGDEVMTRLRAIRRSASTPKNSPDAPAPSAG